MIIYINIYIILLYISCGTAGDSLNIASNSISKILSKGIAASGPGQANDRSRSIAASMAQGQPGTTGQISRAILSPANMIKPQHLNMSVPTQYTCTWW